MPHFPTTPGLPITSPYGWRIDPIDGTYKHHNGIDIGGGGVEHPIYATQTGIIILNTFTSYGGYTLRIQHTGDKYFSQYQHLKEAPALDVGEVVTIGQEIATMGSTGDSTGIHLDFQIATSATGFHTMEGTIDPEIYLQTGGGYIPKKSKFKPWLFTRKRRIIFK